jgi:hypothetical protein
MYAFINYSTESLLKQIFSIKNIPRRTDKHYNRWIFAEIIVNEEIQTL